MQKKNLKKQKNKSERDLFFVSSITACLLILTFLVFSRSLHQPFINFDDSIYITENPTLQQGFSWHTLKWAFRTVYSGDWQPLIWISFLFDFHFFGLNPYGFHFSNLLFHSINAVLVFLIFRKITGWTWRAAFLAAFFAIHPLRVESVVWISERKDVLSSFFWLLAIGFYLKAHWDKNKDFLSAALIFYFFSVLSKPMVVTMPLLLLLLDYWPLRRWNSPAALGSLLTEKVVFFFLAGFSSMMAIYANHSIHAIVSLQTVSLPQRFLNAGVSYWQYVTKTILPFNLSIFYPFPHQETQSIGLVSLCFLALGSISILAWRKKEKMPAIFVGWYWYLFTLIPVLGLIRVSNQAMANRYTYFPHIGLGLMFLGLFELLQKKTLKFLGFFAGVPLLLFWAGLTKQQVTYWDSPITLNEYAVHSVPNNYMAYMNLGYEYYKTNEWDKSLEFYQKAIKINPTPMAISNTANMLFEKGYREEAKKMLETALEKWPWDISVCHNLGLMYALERQDEKAEKLLFKAAKLEKNAARSRNVLARFYIEKGKYAEARPWLESVLKRFPKNQRSNYLMGILHEKEGDLDAAISFYERAIEGEANSWRAVNRLSLLLMEQGKLEAAEKILRDSIQENPTVLQVYLNLGNILMLEKKHDEAVLFLQRALSLKPNSETVKSLLKQAAEAKEKAESGNAPEAMGESDFSGLNVSSPEELQSLFKILGNTTANR